MKKKLALILISTDECFPQKGFSGGGHKVTKNLILGLIESNKFEIDIFCQKGEDCSCLTFPNICSINVLGKKDFINNLKSRLESKHYDYVLSSDILLPFANNLIHSNSSMHKSKNGKNKFMQLILKVYNSKKINRQKSNLPTDKAIFTVSSSLKNDYVSNFGLDENKVFVAYPAVDEPVEYLKPIKNNALTIGSIVGGGLNKGGYILLFAIKLMKNPICAKVIFPKFHKSGFYRKLVKLLGLENVIEVIPKQKNMGAYYNSIDCYVLPSLNEAFGLVVTEAALNFKPSIVSSTTGVRELVDDNITGFIFDREKNSIKNLANKLDEVSDLYSNQNEKFNEIAKNSHNIVTKLAWKNFTDIIINNMIAED